MGYFGLHFGFTLVVWVLLVNGFVCAAYWFLGAWKELKLYVKLLITKFSCNLTKLLANQQVCSSIQRVKVRGTVPPCCKAACPCPCGAGFCGEARTRSESTNSTLQVAEVFPVLSTQPGQQSSFPPCSRRCDSIPSPPPRPQRPLRAAGGPAPPAPAASGSLHPPPLPPCTGGGARRRWLSMRNWAGGAERRRQRQRRRRR